MPRALHRIEAALATLPRPAAAAVLIVLSLAAFLPAFTTLPPLDRDEARFAQSSRQMAASGDLIDIRFQDGTRYKKPVGIYWLQAAAVTLTRAPDTAIWSHRLPSLLAAIAAVLMTARIAAVFGGPQVGLWAGILMAGTFLLGAEARLAKTDAALLLTILLAQSVLARTYLRAHIAGFDRSAMPSLPWGQVALFWAALAASFLIKGPIGPMVVALTAAALACLHRRARWLGILRPGAGLLILGALVVPWYLAITLKAGSAFWAEALGRDLLSKVQSAQESHGAPPGSYLAALWITFFPASAALLLALPAVWRGRKTPGLIFAAAWAIPVWLVFEASPTKLVHYVLPAYPALAMAVALVWAGEMTARPALWQRLLLWPVLTLPAVVLAAIGAFAATLGPVPLLPLAVGIAGIAVGSAVFASSRTQPTLALLGLCLTGAAFSGSVFATATRISALWPAPAILALIPSNPDCPAHPIAIAGYSEPSLVFLSPAPVTFTDPASALGAMEQDPCTIAVIPSGIALPMAAQTLGHVEGLNLGTGRRLDLAILSAAR